MLFAIVWTMIILIGCSMPGNELPKVHLFDHVDKVIHFIFFVFFFIFWNFSPTKYRQQAFVWIVFSFLLGFGIEFYQLNFVKGRSFDIWDGVADTLGALAGWQLIRYYHLNTI